VDLWDHGISGFIARTWTVCCTFSNRWTTIKTVVLDTPPTAENLALTAFRILDAAYRILMATT